MIQYSPKSIKARALLLRPYNDIDVFVEDVNSTNMYVEYINRVLEDKGHIESVITVGSKDLVIEACIADKEEDGRKKIYVIDGDFDCISNNRITDIDNLYQLDVYCFENLLVCNIAIVEILYECLHNKSRLEIEDSFNPKNFLFELANRLKPLLIIYYHLYLLNSGIKTMGTNFTKFIDNGLPYLPEIEKIQNEVFDLENSINPDHSSSVTISAFTKKLEENPIFVLKFISGKSFLIPAIYFFLRTNSKYQGDNNELKVRLARYCSLDKDIGFCNAIKALL